MTSDLLQIFEEALLGFYGIYGSLKVKNIERGIVMFSFC